MKTRRFHFIQHVPFEGPGVILTWAVRNGYQISSTRVWMGEPFPETGDFDWLLIMGGPMSVNDEREFPWLIREKELVRRSVGEGKRVLGICLGAQLIASALGAEVLPNPEREIGWFPLFSEVEDETGFAGLTAFHWHGETFRLPEGAVHLCRSEGCLNQAFRLGKHTVALQFHLEVDELSVRGMTDEMKHELIPSRYVMGPETILANLHNIRDNQRAMFSLLDRMDEGA
ncbi:MAG: type 1 glutamine amidotransferase [Bacteroidota bacterium]